MTVTAWTNPFAVNTSLEGFQFFAKAAALKDGSFVAVWEDASGTGADDDSSAIRGQLFHADGTKKGGEFLVNTTYANNQSRPEIAVLSDGRFVVAWTDNSNSDDTSDQGVRARIFNADGSAFGRTGTGTNDFQVNATTTAGKQSGPMIVALQGGGFAVTFDDQGSNFRSQLFDVQGHAVGEDIQVRDDDFGLEEGTTAAVGLGDRYMFISMGAGSTLAARIISGTHNGDAKELTISDSESGKALVQAAQLTDGRIVVAWTSLGLVAGSAAYVTKAQILNADGSRSGGELQLSSGTDIIQIASEVAALPGGGFAVTLASAKTTADLTENGLNVSVVGFDANGHQSGFLTVAHNTPSSTLNYSNLVTLADGRVVALWSQAPSDSSDDTIGETFGQIVDPRTSGVTLSGTEGSDTYYGSAFADRLSGRGGADKLTGANGDDRILGEAGNDTLKGDAGHDTLDGGLGDDALDGGLGDDTFIIDSLADTLTDAGGLDTLVTAVSYTLAALSPIENLTLAEGTAALSLTGNAGANVLKGNAGANTLSGGLGADTLSGGAGKDLFVLSAAVAKKSNQNIDLIRDFAVKDDTIWLDNAVFKAFKGKASLKKPLKVDAKALWSVSKGKAKAHDGDDRLVYDKKSGKLFYDQDGTGSQKQIHIATLETKAKINHKDFFIV